MKFSDSAEFSKELRILVLKMVHEAKASHVGSALSIADIITVLYYDILNIRPDQPGWESRDRFILSKGHACTAVYAALALKGFVSEAQVMTFGKDGSDFMNHISHKVPGVEFSTGALGHGLPFGVGKALALKKNGKNARVYVLLSDGEMDEGSNWEAMLFAAHHKLDNLTMIIDYNKLQSLDSVENTLSLEPLGDKLRSFGFILNEVDGHKHCDLREALNKANQARPTVVLAHTIKGKGVPFMENQVLWHYRSPDLFQLEEAIKAIRNGL